MDLAVAMRSARLARMYLVLSRTNRAIDQATDVAGLLDTLAPNGHLHNVGAVLKPLEVPAFSLILGQKSVSGSPTGSPTTIDYMLAFSARHSITPITEAFPMSKLNDALERLRSGIARYRIVLINDFAKSQSAGVSRPEEQPVAMRLKAFHSSV